MAGKFVRASKYRMSEVNSRVPLQLTLIDCELICIIGHVFGRPTKKVQLLRTVMHVTLSGTDLSSGAMLRWAPHISKCMGHEFSKGMLRY